MVKNGHGDYAEEDGYRHKVPNARPGKFGGLRSGRDRARPWIVKEQLSDAFRNQSEGDCTGAHKEPADSRMRPCRPVFCKQTYHRERCEKQVDQHIAQQLPRHQASFP